ncbi:hypothetical protein E4U56_006782 [Claviceps arundinis]|uniref:Uncharacterized protein n=1 Tax=Claviceps arundinis TaxID=1623583 RepID=A0A9P7MLY7_9HYPO|nr:hypothetical protein E4U56_006782 [Claviceps arundinis]
MAFVRISTEEAVRDLFERLTTEMLASDADAPGTSGEVAVRDPYEGLTTEEPDSDADAPGTPL